jgi:hypothetical protein
MPRKSDRSSTVHVRLVAVELVSNRSSLMVGVRLVKGAPRRAGPDDLDVEHEKRARIIAGEMSGQSGPP